MISIRPAVPEDVPLILTFIRELARYERLEHALAATEADLTRTLFGARPYAQVLFACREGAPVGFAVYFYNYSTFMGRPGLYLEDLFVRPDSRGLGVGRRLLEHLARLAIEQDCARFEWAVLDWNEPAIGFYKRLGAVANDEWTGYRLTGDALARLASR
jgi:GNAT superfamily N-acetyltransferase